MIKKACFSAVALALVPAWVWWASAARAEMVYGRDQMTCFVEAVDRDTGGDGTTPVGTVVGALESGRTTRSSHARAEVTSTEFRRSVVGDLYWTMLGRWPDAGGLAHWTSRYSSSADLAAALLGSDEYYSRVGRDPGSFVNALHGALVGRPATREVARSLTNELANGLTRPALARRIWLSAESNGRRVDRMYARLLRRSPDQAGRAFWAERLRVVDDIELAVLLISSAEYLHRAQACRPEMTGRVMVIGDSLTVGATRGGLHSGGLARGMWVDALDGRRIADGVRILKRADLTQIDHLVIALGSNDFRSPDHELEGLISDTLTAAGGRPVTWVNIDTGARLLAGGDRFNRLLRAAAVGHPNLEVADWDRHMAERPDRGQLRHADGVHYSPAGNEVRASWMAALAATGDPWLALTSSSAGAAIPGDAHRPRASGS